VTFFTADLLFSDQHNFTHHRSEESFINTCHARQNSTSENPRGHKGDHRLPSVARDHVDIRSPGFQLWYYILQIHVCHLELVARSDDICISLRAEQTGNNRLLRVHYFIFQSPGYDCYLSWCGQEDKGSVHITAEKFENEALFLRLGLPSTLIRHENGAFRKRSSNRRNLKTPAFRFRMDGKHFENGALNTMTLTIIMWFFCPSNFQT